MKLNIRISNLIGVLGGILAVFCLGKIYLNTEHTVVKAIIWLALAITALSTVHLIFLAARRETLNRIAKLERGKGTEK